MAITGKFVADFSQFNDAVNKAETQLKSFESESSKVERALSRMGDSFGGRKVIQDATLMAQAIEHMGGVASLTGKELQRAGALADEALAKMKARGDQVPPTLQNIADAARRAREEEARLADETKRVAAEQSRMASSARASGDAMKNFVSGFNIQDAITNPMGTASKAVTTFGGSMTGMGTTAVAAGTGVAALGAAVFGLAKYAADAGADLDDLADQLGLSVPALSRLQNAATVAGADMGKVTTAIFKMQAAMADTDPEKLESGLKRIGLSFETFKAAGPDKQLEMLADAFARAEDPIQRAAAAQEIFKDKTGEMIPFLRDMGKALELTNDISPWTDEQAADAEKFIMQLESIKVHISALAEAMGRDLIPYFLQFLEMIKTAAPYLGGLMEAFAPIRSTLGLFKDGFDAARQAWKEFRGDTESGVKGLVDNLKAPAQALAPLPGIAGAMGRDMAKGMDLAASASSALNASASESIARHQAAAAAAKKHAEEAAKIAVVLAELDAVGTNWRDTLAQIDGETVDAISYYLQAGVAQDTLAKAYGLTKTQIQAVAESVKLLTLVETENREGPMKAMATLQADLAGKLKRTFDDTSKSFSSNQDAMVQSAQRTAALLDSLSVDSLAKQIRHIREEGAARKRGLDEHASNYQATMDQIDHETEVAVTVATAKWDAGMHEMEQASLSFGTVFRGVMESIPDIMASAFLGASSLTAAFSQIAQQLGQRFVDTFKLAVTASINLGISAFNKFTAGAAAFTGALQGIQAGLSGASAKTALISAGMAGLGIAATTVGTAVALTGTATAATVGSALALGAATAGIGAAAVGAYFGLKKLFSDTEKAVNPVREQFVQLHGGLFELAKAAQAAGTNLDAMLKAKNLKDYQKAIDDLNKSLKLQEIRDAFIKTMGGIDLLREKAKAAGIDIEKAFSPKTVEELNAALDEAKRKLDLHDEAFQKVQEAMDKYHISVEEMGPAWAKQELDKKAMELFEDYKLLIAAGADQNLVIEKMGDSLKDYVEKSRKAGTSIPESMRPIIEKMIEMGMFTDDAGNKITNMQDLGVTFQETMDEKFEKLIEKISELTTSLQEGLGAPLQTQGIDKANELHHAIDAIPKDIKIKVTWEEIGTPPDTSGGGTGTRRGNGGAMGGLVTATGIVAPAYLASGGIVGQTFTGYRMTYSSPFGTDNVPAWLTPGELVLTQKHQRALFEGLQQRATPPPITVHVFVEKDGTASVMTDQSAFNRRVQEAMKSGAVVVPSSVVVPQL